MKDVLNKMIEQLSDEDKEVFGQLAEKLKAVDGDISKLSTDELELISRMETKYADKFEKIGVEEEIDSEVFESKDTLSISLGPDDILNCAFASYARQILARDLKSQFPKEEDAVRFAFQNKWLPDDFKQNDSALQLFEDYKQDICDANQWREEVVGVESDKRMAVGLTWFMVLFKLNEKLS